MVAMVFLAIGGVFAAASARLAYRSLWFAHFGAPVQGSVANVVPSNDAFGNPRATLSVEYPGADGTTYRIASLESDRYLDVRIGDRVAVLHDAEEPGDARIDNRSEQAYRPAMIGLLGLLFLVPGFVVLRHGLGQRRAQWDLTRQGRDIEAEYVGVRRVEDPEVFARERDRMAYVEARGGAGPAAEQPGMIIDSATRYVLLARWTAPDGQVHAFESVPLHWDPDPLMRGRPVQVRLNLAQPQEYRIVLPGGATALAPPRPDPGRTRRH